MKRGFKVDIEKLTLENENYRQVLYSGEHSQLVLMCLPRLEEIGLEVHEKIDQFFRIEAGVGKVIINNTEYDVKSGDVIIVPSGAKHNVINTSSDTELKFYTLYSPAHHKDGLVLNTKEDEKTQEKEFDGATTEGNN